MTYSADLPNPPDLDKLMRQHAELVEQVSQQGGQIGRLTAEVASNISAIEANSLAIHELQGTDPAEPVDPPPVVPDPEPTPPPTATAIIPGPGWTGPTPTPPQIGSVTEPVIAHWDVVPEQAIGHTFAVGVIAHHLDGIDRVEIAANDGNWVTISKPSINPRTGQEEYWANLNTEWFTADTINLRAIAYPKVGQPVVVKTIDGRSQNLTLYTREMGEVIELDAGRHTLTKRNLPNRGWLTYRPKPGVDRKDCIIENRSSDWQDGKLKFESLTLNMPGGDGMIRGKWGTRNENQYFWADNCNIIGAGPSVMCKSPAKFWTASFFTYCDLRDMQVVFDDALMLTRDCYIFDIYEDVFRIGGLHVGHTIEDVDRQPMLDAGADVGRPHPDIFQAKAVSRTIMQDITAIENINGQGFYIKDGDERGTDGVALKRVNIKCQGSYTALHLFDQHKNLLIEDSTFNKALLRGEIPSGERAVIRNSTVPSGWTGEEVIE